MNTDTIRDYLDVVALGRTPTTADLENTLTAAIAPTAVGETPIDVDQLRQTLTAATRAIRAAATEGNTGEARRRAAEEAQAIRATYVPTSDNDPGDYLRSVVDSIPRRP